MQDELYEAAERGLLVRIQGLLRDDCVDINLVKQHWIRPTALHLASEHGHVTVVRELLKVPGINPNKLDSFKRTPLILACWKGEIEVVRVLLRDPRVKADLAEDWGKTPLWWAASCGNEVIAKWLVASGKDLNLAMCGGVPFGEKSCTAKEVAKRRGYPGIVTLLGNFQRDPEGTRFEVELELGQVEQHIANVFALVVFLSDDYLVLEEETEIEDTAEIGGRRRRSSSGSSSSSNTDGGESGNLPLCHCL